MSDHNTVVDVRQFVQARDGKTFTTSQNVAEAFGKQHHHVMQKLESLECSGQFLTRNFSRVQFEHRGNRYDAVEMTKDGFMFLVMGFTGKKAAAIKEGYISAFNWMAEQLGLSSKDLVAKAVHDALGADGARIISNVIRCRIAKLDLSVQRSAAMKLSSALHARFSVPRIEQIPSDQMEAACNFVASYAIEGEYLGKEEPAGVVVLDAYAAQHVYLLMSRIASMNKDRDSLGNAARSLDSKPLMSVYSQLLESRSSFGYLDTYIGKEIYRAYRSLGMMDGGYAAGAAA